MKDRVSQIAEMEKRIRALENKVLSPVNSLAGMFARQRLARERHALKILRQNPAEIAKPATRAFLRS